MVLKTMTSQRCRSKVGASFQDKDKARQVRKGKYSLVDLDSFEPADLPKVPATDKLVSRYDSPPSPNLAAGRSSHSSWTLVMLPDALSLVTL